MRRIVLILVVLIASVLVTEAQKLTSVVPYGSKALYEVTPTNDTLIFTPKYSASAYVVPVAENKVFQVNTLSSLPCNIVYFQVSADATKRYVTFSTGLQASRDSIAANKTRTWGFVYVKNKYVLHSRTAEY